LQAEDALAGNFPVTYSLKKSNIVLFVERFPILAASPLRDPLKTGHESYGLFSMHYDIFLPDLQKGFPEKLKRTRFSKQSYEIFVQEKPKIIFNVP
jgi:hypothetical protein